MYSIVLTSLKEVNITGKHHWCMLISIAFTEATFSSKKNITFNQLSVSHDFNLEKKVIGNS